MIIVSLTRKFAMLVWHRTGPRHDPRPVWLIL